ncbi:MAG: hypothetical protein ABGY10_03680 [bacterium]
MTTVCGPMTGKMYDIAGGTPAHHAARLKYWTEMAQQAIPPESAAYAAAQAEEYKAWATRQRKKGRV